MSALSELQARGGQIDVRILGPFFWGWYHRHARDTIIRRKILVFRVTILVKDLYPLFVQLFGPEPETTVIANPQ